MKYYNYYYRIFDKPSNSTIKNLKIEFDPANDVLSAFFNSPRISDYPDLLNSAANSEGFGGEYWHYRPYGIMDWEDIANAVDIKENEVHVIHDIIGSTILEEIQFCKILEAYSIKLLEVYYEDGDIQQEYTYFLQNKLLPNSWGREPYLHFNPIWSKAMEEGIKKLQIKIGSMK